MNFDKIRRTRWYHILWSVVFVMWLLAGIPIVGGFFYGFFA